MQCGGLVKYKTGGDRVLFSSKECKQKYGNYYQINKAVQAGILYKVAEGIYSDTLRVSEIEIIMYRYPQTVFTLNSAFYYHGLTDVIPNKYYLAAIRDTHKIPNPKIKQIFYSADKFTVGISDTVYQGTNIRIYDRERMLIELIRSGKNLSFDYYKEIIESYRRSVHTLDIQKLQEYILAFPKSDAIMEAIELEVL
jgi:predicted transcriptional regulator of viral defense system